MLTTKWIVIGIVLGGCSGAADNSGTEADASTTDAMNSLGDAGPVGDARQSPDAGQSPSDAATTITDAATPLPGALRSPPYLMWVTDSEVTVRWETESAVVGYVDFGTTSGLGRLATENAAGTSHEVRLTGMQAGTVHYYRIGWDGYGLETETFSTAPPDGNTDFRFVAWGDNQDGPDDFETITGLMDLESPDFAISSGDCVQNGTRTEYRSQLFEPISALADHVPFLVGAGNHERYSDSGADLFDEYMSQPGDEHCFGWRYGSVYFMFIDTELDIDPGTPQGDCIANALSSPRATSAAFRAAVFHKPPRVNWWFGGSLAFTNEMEAPWVRETLEPMLESLDVDIVFNGHNHLYAYSPETSGGITWVTSGGGGGQIDTDFGLWRVGNWSAITQTRHENHFLVVDVVGSDMTVRAVNIDGQEIHQFTISSDMP